MNQNTSPLQSSVGKTEVNPHGVTPGSVIKRTEHVIAPHRVLDMPILETPTVTTVTQSAKAPTYTVVKKKDNTFYAAVIVFGCLIVAMTGYLLLAISNRGNTTNIINNTPVNNIPVSDGSVVIPKFIEKSFALNKKIIWNVTYPETFFADESKIDSGAVTLAGEYLDYNIKVSMTFPTFEKYHTTTPLYLSDWLKAEKVLVDEVDAEQIRTELITIEGLEAAIVYNYPEIAQELPNRILGLDKTIIVYIWKNENNNPRRLIFEMDEYNQTFLSDFVKDFVAEMSFR